MQRAEAPDAGVVDQQLDRTKLADRDLAGHFIRHVGDQSDGVRNLRRRLRDRASIEVEKAKLPSIGVELFRDREADVAGAARDDRAAGHCHFKLRSKTTG